MRSQVECLVLEPRLRLGDVAGLFPAPGRSAAVLAAHDAPALLAVQLTTGALVRLGVAGHCVRWPEANLIEKKPMSPGGKTLALEPTKHAMNDQRTSKHDQNSLTHSNADMQTC